jgi:hypothetical protein
MKMKKKVVVVVVAVGCWDGREGIKVKGGLQQMGKKLGSC